MKDLTISIVSYHGYEDICAAVESIEKHTDISISKTIYIIDNANEPETFKPLTEKYSDVEYVNTGANLGFGNGHNYILNRIDSRYHALVNPDILLVEDSFSKIFEFFETDSEIGAVAPKIVDDNGNMLLVYRREIKVSDILVRNFPKSMFKKKRAHHTMQDMDYTKPFQIPFAQGSFLVFKTDLFKQLGGFDDRYFMYVEDADLCKQVNQISKVMYFPGTTVTHRWEKASHTNFTLMKIHISSLIKYFQKWGI